MAAECASWASVFGEGSELQLIAQSLGTLLCAAPCQDGARGLSEPRGAQALMSFCLEISINILSV
jgi:hypothetical protein